MTSMVLLLQTTKETQESLMALCIKLQYANLASESELLKCHIYSQTQFYIVSCIRFGDTKRRARRSIVDNRSIVFLDIDTAVRLRATLLHRNRLIRILPHAFVRP